MKWRHHSTAVASAVKTAFEVVLLLWLLTFVYSSTFYGSFTQLAFDAWGNNWWLRLYSDRKFYNFPHCNCLPQLSAATICRNCLPQLSASTVCRNCLPKLSAATACIKWTSCEWTIALNLLEPVQIEYENFRLFMRHKNKIFFKPRWREQSQ